MRAAGSIESVERYLCHTHYVTTINHPVLLVRSQLADNSLAELHGITEAVFEVLTAPVKAQDELIGQKRREGT